MSYKLKSEEDFSNYLSQYLIKNPFDYNSISIDTLSGLYNFFLQNKKSSFSKNLYDRLNNIIQNTLNIEQKIMTFDEDNAEYIITDENINTLEIIIKDRYLEYLSSKPQNISEEELYKLAVIVSKKFPEQFVDLIETSIPPKDFKQQLDYIRNTFQETIDVAIQHTTSESKEEIIDIGSSIYITYKDLFPELDIYIPGRGKSINSSINNIVKETKNSIFNLIPSIVKNGLSYSDVENQFNINKAKNDFSAFTIVLTNTDDALHFDKNDSSSKEIYLLRKQRANNLSFIHSLENFLDSDTNLSFKELMQIKIELLIRLRGCTYNECFSEYKNTSFSKLLEDSIKAYEGLKTDKSPNLDTLNITNEIYDLLDELKDRVHDKYQFKLLEITIPEVLNDPLFQNILKVKHQFVKKVIKPNGFVSLYYYLITQDNKIIEVQAQSKKRYKDSKIGSSDHSQLENKELDIEFFFEPTSPEISKQIFENNLKILNNTPISLKNFLLSSEDTELNPVQTRQKRQLRAAIKSVKLKDFIEFKSEYTDEKGNLISSIYKEPIDKYLPKFAEFHSPKLYAFSSPHTRFNTSISGYNEKSLVTNFREVLLKHDYTSCLAQVLIDKLEEIIPLDKNTISRNGIVKRSKSRESSSR